MASTYDKQELFLFNVPVRVERRSFYRLARDGTLLDQRKIGGASVAGMCAAAMHDWLFDRTDTPPRLKRVFLPLLETVVRDGHVMARDHVGEYGRWSLVFLPGGDDEVIMLLEDVSLLDQAAERLRVADTVFRRIPTAMVVTNTTPVILFCNAAVQAVTGYAPDELIGRNPILLRSDRTHRGDLERIWHQVMTEGFWSGEIWARKKGGMEYPQWLAVIAVRDMSGKPYRLVSIFRDISRSRQQQEFMQYLTHRDVLTGLRHRNAFIKEGCEAIRSARELDLRMAVAVLDLDEFNLINRTHGFRFGDSMLKKVTERLEQLEEQGVVVARLGADEFGLFFPIEGVDRQVEIVGDRCVELLKAPFLTEQGSIYLTAGIGFAIYPDHGEKMDTLLRHAEEAMLSAKNDSRNVWKVYTRSMAGAAEEHLKLKTDLYHAVQRGEFELYYQPRLDVVSGRIRSAECLIRWRHPRSGRLLPGSFIELAEESDLILPIGRWVLEHATTQIRKWRDGNVSLELLSVNLSPIQLFRGDPVRLIQDLLDQTGIPPGSLELELTETALAMSLDQAITVLAELRELGVRIAMDDFGTGYSSLNYLRKLPLDAIKIDRGFVTDVLTEPNARAIIRLLVELSRELGLRTVAEGVESREQFRILSEAGCDEIQGFLVAPAMPAIELERFIRSFQPITF